MSTTSTAPPAETTVQAPPSSGDRRGTVLDTVRAFGVVLGPAAVLDTGAAAGLVSVARSVARGQQPRPLALAGMLLGLKERAERHTASRARRRSGRAHAALYRATGGRLLGRMGGRPVLLLTTTGRRTGAQRTTPVQYLARDGGFVLVAAAGGAPRPPAWYLNLQADPRAQVQVGADTFDVHARTATGDERAELWRELTTANRCLERVERKAGRQLPVVVLTPGR